ncbi:MAG: selenide, water dikinase SelD [Deltaproteobacteria bacterium]|nr:selenide, water dikinase SelD [Deltaproteobacteria bacterium]
MRARALMQVLRRLPKIKDKNLLVGYETADDAAVYRITKGLALITTLDFFPPIVDDPSDFGEIAAANALSDVYAMGGHPRLAMNIVCFPRGLPPGTLNSIIKGALKKLKEAGAVLVGGHSIEDCEVKFGLSVAGFVSPDKILTNSGARPGDALVLTKPIGTGIITTALKAGRIRPKDAKDAIDSMKALNKGASEAACKTGVNGCTDITGYGLIGHAIEMARASAVSLVIRTADVEVFPHAKRLAHDKACRPGAIKANMEYFSRDVRMPPAMDKAAKALLFDPQTSGGLLLSAPEKKKGLLIRRLKNAGIKASIIGAVLRKKGAFIKVE